MTFISRLRQLDEDPDSSPYHRKTNNEGGPGGPLNIEKALDWEIQWDKGRAQLLHRPERTTMPKKPIDETTRDATWDRRGANTGTLPSDPNGPIDKIEYRNRDTKITEDTAMSYMKKLEAILAANTTSFVETIKVIKTLFPEIRMRFPTPPTYVWNPPKEEEAKDKKGKTQDEDTSPEAHEDKTATLKPQEIKDKIKTKIPDLVWDTRMMDGIENAEMIFDNHDSATFEIGMNADHLTITYTPPDPDAEEQADEDINPAFTGGA